MTQHLPSRSARSRRRAVVGATLAVAVAAAVDPAIASTPQSGSLSAATASTSAAVLATTSPTTLSPDTFASPPAGVRPIRGARE